MNALRWTIGIVTGLATIGWIALVTIAGSFRRSFGASEKSPLLLAASVAGLLLVIASVVWPERRVVLHVVAVLMLALCVGCVLIARETMFVATVGVIYAATWLMFYYRAVWATGSVQSTPF